MRCVLCEIFFSRGNQLQDWKNRDWRGKSRSGQRRLRNIIFIVTLAVVLVVALIITLVVILGVVLAVILVGLPRRVIWTMRCLAEVISGVIFVIGIGRAHFGS